MSPPAFKRLHYAVGSAACGRQAELDVEAVQSRLGQVPASDESPIVDDHDFGMEVRDRPDCCAGVEEGTKRYGAKVAASERHVAVRRKKSRFRPSNCPVKGDVRDN